jgi:hypothetical protein
MCMIYTASVYAENETIFQHHQTTIPTQQSAENLVVIGGDAHIHGAVRELVIVVNGDLHITKTAYVPGIIFVFGGHIDQESGAQVTDEVVNVSLDDPTMNSFMIGGSFLIGGQLVGFVFSLVGLLFSLLTSAVWKERLYPWTTPIRQQPIRLTLIGVATSVFLLAVGFFFSVIGVPILLFSLILLLPVYLWGLTILSQIVGEWIPRMEDKPLWLKTSLGSILVLSLHHFPLVGGIVFLCLLWISLGIVVWWIWAKRKGSK